MEIRRSAVIASAVAGAMSMLGGAGVASAAFPNFSDCPRSSGINTCIDIQSNSGSISIKGFNVPLDHSLEIRGGARFDASGTVFVPPAGSNGFFAQPVDVPGGLLGINLPIPGNKVTATAQLVGGASAIKLDFGSLGMALPIKLQLSNPLIGSGCQIGSNSNPAQLNLITGTTSPPPPNTPISGSIGTVSSPDGNTTIFQGNVNVDNSFAVPGANSCGFLGLGLIDALVNAKLKLPSAAGNNTMSITNSVALQVP